MKLRIMAVALAGACVTGCVSSGGADAIKPIASDVATKSYVKEVVLAGTPDGASPQFKDTFASKVSDKLKDCAKGTKALRLEATIVDFHRSSGLKTWMIGDANRIKGTAKLIDPESGAVVADYDINRSVGGGGLIAAVAMSDAEGQMSTAFGDELCKRAFVSR